MGMLLRSHALVLAWERLMSHGLLIHISNARATGFSHLHDAQRSGAPSVPVSSPRASYHQARALQGRCSVTLEHMIVFGLWGLQVHALQIRALPLQGIVPLTRRLRFHVANHGRHYVIECINGGILEHRGRWGLPGVSSRMCFCS